MLEEFKKDFLEVERKFEVIPQLNLRVVKENSKEILTILQSYFVDQKDGKYKRVRLQTSQITGEKKTVFCEKVQVGYMNGVPLVKEIEEDADFQVGVDLILSSKLKFVEKTRYILNISGYDFEIDKYHNLIGEFENLITAEVEFKNEQDLLSFDKIEKPDFIVRELTGDKKYSNANLSKMTNTERGFPYLKSGVKNKM